jgi:hypothetical protein
MELVSRHLSGALNFEVALTFLKIISTPAFKAQMLQRRPLVLAINMLKNLGTA